MQPGGSSYPDFEFNSGSYATTTAVTPSNCQSGPDQDLTEIINSIIDFVPDNPAPTSSVATSLAPNPDFNEKIMISAIQQSLMQVENTAAFNNSPPAYSMHNINTQSNQQVIISSLTHLNTLNKILY